MPSQAPQTSESPTPARSRSAPSLRERIGAGILVCALVMLPVGVTSPDVGAASSVIAGIAMYVLARTPPPAWADKPWLTKAGVIVTAWAAILLSLDNMTEAGTPPVLLPAIIAVGLAMATVGALGLDRILRGALTVPPALRTGEPKDPGGR